MIQKFKHKGLKRLFESGISSGIDPQHADRIRKILALLETDETIEDMDLPGLSRPFRVIPKIRYNQKNSKSGVI